MLHGLCVPNQCPALERQDTSIKDMQASIVMLSTIIGVWGN